MLLVKTYIAQSKIHGFGLFAGEVIKQGTITWKFDPAIDLMIGKNTLDDLPKLTQEFINEYGSLSKLSGNYILSADNARFTNHSKNPNLDTKVIKGELEAVAYATCDIKKGEEITIDYTNFDKLSDTSQSTYLKT